MLRCVRCRAPVVGEIEDRFAICHYCEGCFCRACSDDPGKIEDHHEEDRYCEDIDRHPMRAYGLREKDF